MASARSTSPRAYVPCACHSAPRSSGGTKPPNPPAAPTKPVIEPTIAGSLARPMRAKTPPAPIPNPIDMTMKAIVAIGMSGGSATRATAQRVTTA